MTTILILPLILNCPLVFFFFFFFRDPYKHLRDAPSLSGQSSPSILVSLSLAPGKEHRPEL